MDKKLALKTGGIVAIILGSIALFFGDGDSGTITSIGGGIFTLVGIIVNAIGGKRS